MDPVEPDVNLAALLAEQNKLLADIAPSLKKIAELMDRPSPGWRRMLDEFRGAVSRMPTSIRMHP